MAELLNAGVRALRLLNIRHYYQTPQKKKKKKKLNHLPLVNLALERYQTGTYLGV
jgi:hypothetical protein